MKKVTKAQVKKAIRENGKVEVGLAPCKANLDSPWISLMVQVVESNEELERFINSFAYYNCNYEMGYYPHYYID